MTSLKTEIKQNQNLSPKLLKQMLATSLLTFLIAQKPFTLPKMTSQ